MSDQQIWLGGFFVLLALIFGLIELLDRERARVIREYRRGDPIVKPLDNPSERA